MIFVSTNTSAFVFADVFADNAYPIAFIAIDTAYVALDVTADSSTRPAVVEAVVDAPVAATSTAPALNALSALDTTDVVHKHGPDTTIQK